MLQAKGRPAQFLLPWEREKVSAGRMRVVGKKLDDAPGI
jgi:hypothetical protein